MDRVRRARTRPSARRSRFSLRVLQAAGLVLSGVKAEWDALKPAWRECLGLAWEAYAAGTIPVGAVVVDSELQVVARGRNRVYEQAAPSRQLSDSLLAHAEVNALVELSPERRYEDHAVLTALEPCILCIGATRLATVGRIRYAGPDPYGGASQLMLKGVNPMLDRLALVISGPELGALGRLFAALHAEFFLRRNPESRVVASFRSGEPWLIRLAEGLVTHDLAGMAAAGARLQDALLRVETVIEA